MKNSGNLKGSKMGRPKLDEPTKQITLRFKSRVCDWIRDNKELVIEFVEQQIAKEKKR